MITLETGVPGAGKTLYCVSDLLQKLVNSVVTHEDEQGNKVETKRVIYTNINGLLLEHEKIGPGGEWTYDGKTDKWSQPEGSDKFGLNNWHEWAKPGSVIVYDEVQKPWPLAASGSKVPPCITALETHRHMGVDFIVLTQHPMLIHANLVRLVGRHLHIRRMGNMGLAIVYEWDSCSRTLLYKNALAKAPYRYPKSVFKLYKSAELHTKQPRRIPSLVWGALFGIVAMFAFAPTTFSRIAERVNPTKSLVATAEKGAPASPGQKADIPGQATSAPQPTGAIAEPAEVLAGCARSNTACRCYTTTAKLIDKPMEYCTKETTLQPVLAPPVQFSDRPDTLTDNQPRPDLDLIAWANRDRRLTPF